LLPHAWCVDNDNAVVDPTWDEAEFYFGIPLEVEFVRRLQLEHNDSGSTFLVITRPALHDAIRAKILQADS
jgi:hypothetical protein